VHRGLFLGEVGENLPDHHRIFDAGDDAHRPAAGCAGLDVDPEHALQALRPKRVFNIDIEGKTSGCEIDGAPGSLSARR
jgi:hypothetical protein